MKAYNQLGPTVPYLIRSQNTFATGDFDGDGRVEIASYCPDNNSLNIISYFTYADASPAWANSTGGMLINAWACTQSVPANPNSTAATSWTLRRDDQYFSAKVTGTTDFIAIFNPSQLQVGLLQWSGQQMQTAFVSQTGQLPGGVGLNSADRFFAADINGDHCDEIVLFSPNDLYLIILTWNANTSPAQLQAYTSAHKTAGDWSMSSSDIYIKGHVYGTADQIIAFNPYNRDISLLYFSDSKLLAQPVGHAPFPYSNPSILAADVDGDGYDEVVIYGNDGKGTDPFQVLILKWAPSQSTFMELVTPTSVGFLVGLWHPKITFLSQVGKIASLVTFNTQNESLSVYVATPEGKPNTLVSLWAGATPLIGPNASLTMSNMVSDGTYKMREIVVTCGTSITMGMNSADRFWVADVDGDGDDELVMFSPNDEWLFIIKWDGSALTPRAAAQTALLGWSVELLVQAPSTPFTQVPFTGNQETIYVNISQQLYPLVKSTCPVSDQNSIRLCYGSLGTTDFVHLLGKLDSIPKPDTDTKTVAAALSNEFMYGYISDTLDSQCGSDIRAKYKDLTYANRSEFPTWAQRLTTQPNFIQPMQHADHAAWKVLAKQLAGELDGASSVTEWYYAMAGINSQVQAIKTAAFNEASGYVNENYSSTGNTALYWSEAIIGALIWGGAAIGEIGTGLQVVLAMAASLYGSVSSYDSGTNNSSQNFTFAQMQGQIAYDYEMAQGTVSDRVTTICTDQVLLPLLGGLFSGQPENSLWTITTSDVAALNQGQSATTIQYYATLIPLRFQFILWQNTIYQTPYYQVPNVAYHTYFTNMVSPPAPACAYRTENAGGGNFNIYLLCSSSDPSQQLTYPSQGLFSDLTSNLGVSLEDVFHGNGAWAQIPRTIYKAPPIN